MKKKLDPSEVRARKAAEKVLLERKIRKLASEAVQRLWCDPEFTDFMIAHFEARRFRIRSQRALFHREAASVHAVLEQLVAEIKPKEGL